VVMSEPFLIYDSREKKPKAAIGMRKMIRQTLPVGDYRCSCGCFGIERKESDLDNLKQVLTQINEMGTVYDNSFLIANRSAEEFLNPHQKFYAARCAFIASLMVRGVTPLFVKDHNVMLDIIQNLQRKMHDNKVRGDGEFIHARHVTKKDKKLNILTSLPGISITKAKLILEHFESPIHFLTASKEDVLKLDGFGEKTWTNIQEVLYG